MNKYVRDREKKHKDNDNDSNNGPRVCQPVRENDDCEAVLQNRNRNSVIPKPNSQPQNNINLVQSLHGAINSPCSKYVVRIWGKQTQ